MAGFATIGDMLSACADQGKNCISSWRKVPSQASVAGIWVDLATSPGNPPPNYYASSPLIARALTQDDGVWHGGNCSPSTKHLARWLGITTTANAVPLSVLLVDYVLYYPFIDMDSTDEQALNNSVTLPRYASGSGLFPILVAQAPYIGGASFSLKYTNSAGVAERSTGAVVTNTATFIGSIVNSSVAQASGKGWYIPLQAGDLGVRSIESITFAGTNGGLAALVLVKPLAMATIREIGAAVEICYLTDKPSMPQIIDGACINMLAMSSTGSIAAAPIFGEMQFTWS